MSVSLLETMEAPSIYLPTLFTIQDVRPMAQTEKLFTVELPEGISLNHRPGQFVEVSVLGVGEAPIVITTSPSRSKGFFELCVRRVGAVTNALHALEPGDEIGIRGPFGNGFPIERFQGKDMLFVPGGMGLPPMRSLINEVLDRRGNFGRVIILYGTRHPSELLFPEELDEWGAREDVELHLAVERPDENWKGNIGVVTTLFPKVQVSPRNTVAVTIGPPVMYRYVLMELMGKSIPDGNIYLSLERRMKCGVGKCGHCQINHLYTCVDGPVFSYAELKNLEEAL